VKIIVVILRPVSTVMRLLPRSLRYIYVFIVLSVVLSISLLTYIVQLVAKIRTPGITRNGIELLIGENNIREVRRDLLQVLPFEESSTSNKNRDLGTIREDAKERMQTAELTFSVAIAVAFLIHEYSGQVIITIESPVERLIQIYVPTLTLATVFRTTLVDVLAYSSEDEPDGIIHEKAVAWQLAITQVGGYLLYPLWLLLLEEQTNLPTTELLICFSSVMMRMQVSFD